MSSDRPLSEPREKDVSPAETQPLPKQTLHPAIYVIAWISLSSAVILFNKWILNGCDFPYPIFLTTWHMLFATVATRGLAQTTQLLDSRKEIPITWSVYVKAIIPIGLIFSLSLICGNQAYLYLSVPFIQMLKATTPVTVLLASWGFGLAEPNMKVLANVSIIVCGIIVASYGELAFNLTGFTFQAFGIVFEATRLVLIQQLLSSPEYKMDGLVSLHYYAPVCTAFNFGAFLIFEAGKVGMKDIARVGIFMLISNAVVAFALNVALVFLIGKTSSLVLTLCGVLKDILLVITSVMIWGTKISSLQICGYSVALIGLMFYKLGIPQLQDVCSQLRTKGKLGLFRYNINYRAPRKVLIGCVFFFGFVFIFGKLLPHNTLVHTSDSLYSGFVGGFGAPYSSWNDHIKVERPILDLSYRPPRGIDFDIVVSMYKENATIIGNNLAKLKDCKPLKDLNVRVIVYVKNENADIENIQRNTGASSVEVLSNRGREGATYLHHIINRWDNLAAHTLFIQGDMHALHKMMNRITDYYVPETGMLSLGFSHAACTRSSCVDAWSSSNVWQRVPEIYSVVYEEICPSTEILLSYTGQFIVSAKRVRGTKKSVYLHLKELLESDGDHWIHGDDRKGKFKDRPDDPYFGHTIERAWMVIFQCGDPVLAKTCPKLDLRRENGDLDSKCQCLDVKPPPLFCT